MSHPISDAKHDYAGKNLRNADFRGAHLAGVSFARATLDGANFSGADLSRADLSNASLVDADLTKATLDDANMRGANVARIRVEGASMKRTRVDLTYASSFRGYEGTPDFGAGASSSLPEGATAFETTNGHPVRCSQCSGERFGARAAVVNSRGMEFLDLGWLNAGATVLSCDACGHLEWFMREVKPR